MMHTPENLTLLLVEDNPGDAALIQELAIEAIPAELIHVNRLAAACRRLAAGGIDLVLLDLSLPDSQGLSTFFATQAQAPQTPIVVLTGLDDEVTALETLNAGAQDYLVKGHLEARELRRAVRYAIERARVQARLTAALREKEALLKETHHRVKNNLQIISSLLNLHAANIDDPVVREHFLESQHRIRAMALVHEQLYQSADLAFVDAPGFVQLLVNQLVRSLRPAASAIDVHLAVDAIQLDIDQAIPLGLIINELVSNIFKHAFPNSLAGEIRVTLNRDAGASLTLVVGDSGVGLPAHLDLLQTNSLGLQLVQELAQQMHGKLCWECHGGTIVTLTIPERIADRA
jgi:two-component sensor histidine kinase